MRIVDEDHPNKGAYVPEIRKLTGIVEHPRVLSPSFFKDVKPEAQSNYQKQPERKSSKST